MNGILNGSSFDLKAFYWLENYLLFIAVVVCDTETEMAICTMSHLFSNVS